MDAKRHYLKVVGDEATLQTLSTNLSKSIKKIGILSIEE
jgi:hypothetical protein